jgi:hypothetical protein
MRLYPSQKVEQINVREVVAAIVVGTNHRPATLSGPQFNRPLLSAFASVSQRGDLDVKARVQVRIGQ